MAFKVLSTFAATAALISVASAALTKRVACSDGVNTASNAACCAWFPILSALQSGLFHNECGQESREALRLMFHDGMGFSPTLGGGGADGSIITFSSTELAFNANDQDTGVADIVDNLKPFLTQFPNVTSGDLLYFAGALGTSNCPRSSSGICGSL